MNEGSQVKAPRLLIKTLTIPHNRTKSEGLNSALQNQMY